MQKFALNIHIDNSLEQLKKFIETIDEQNKIFILTDSNTRVHCLPLLQKLSPRLLECLVIEIQAGESNKNIESLQQIIEQLVEHSAHKNSYIINLGGGVICDIGAFAASIYKRGIKYLHVPTTLLAQIDASIGGKNGIDFLSYKNLLGVISSPEKVFISKQFLQTLNEDELKNGFAEALKHGLIMDRNYWDTIKVSPFKNPDYLIEQSVSIKSAVVLADPFEINERKKLNAGHTIGHALESWKLDQKNPISHGEAVAAGLVIESWMSQQMGYLAKQSFEEIEQFIFSIFNKIEMKNYRAEDLINKMHHDKKNINSKISFSLIRNIGNATTDDYCSDELIIKALEYYSH